MGRSSFGRLFTANSYNRSSGIKLEFPTPKVVSKRAKTDTFGNRKYKENCNFYQKLFTILGETGYSGTSLLISTVRKLPCSSNLLSNCYQPEQLKTSHICEISHYILRPVFIYSRWQYHSNIVKCRSNGNISSVETLSKHLSHFHCSD